MEIFETPTSLEIVSEKKSISFSGEAVTVDGMLIDFPGEYEKSGILIHVSIIDGTPVFEIRLENRSIGYLPANVKEESEELSNFFHNLDLLCISGSKENTKLSEFLDARVVVPYGEGKESFLTGFGQAIEAVDKYKSKESDFEGENTLFVRLV